MSDPLDVVIIGAGLSGVCAAVYIQQHCPGKSFKVFEARNAIGGTWDLFRYPGVRSDSDMYTLGYSFKPWLGGKNLADGPSILSYIKETVAEFNLSEHIHMNSPVSHLNWDSQEQYWQGMVTPDEGKAESFKARFVIFCCGYYDLDEAYVPEFENIEAYKGDIIQPQFWPQDFDYEGKKLVIIGSGATAVTLVPELAKKAAHVTMLQRSPTYVVPAPTEDKLRDFITKSTTKRLGHTLNRWRNILTSIWTYQSAKRWPEATKKQIRGWAQQYLGEDYPVDTHFNPKYDPWDERLCVAPDGDIFMSIRMGQASVVTDEIRHFTASGIELKSGEEIEADAVIMATGLKLVPSGKMHITIDGEEHPPARAMGYRGVMFSDIPNMSAVFGYTNASWTLKCELTCQYTVKLINYMSRHNYAQATPRQNDKDVKPRPWVDLKSGYIQRASNILPSQGSKWPWRLRQNYILDRIAASRNLDDGIIEFKKERQT